MIHLTETHLPEEFIFFLKENPTIEAESGSKIAYAISGFRSLEMLSLRTMKEYDKGKSTLEIIIQTLGWSNFRNRLASVFVEKEISGRFPFKTDLTLVNDLIALEDEIIKHSASGNPRSFFIALYLKLQALDHNVEGHQISNLPYYSRIIDSIKLMEQFKVKVLEIDWLLIQLIHFCEYIPEDAINENIKVGGYDDLYNLLSSEQKKIYANNLLSYGFAINDQYSLVPPAQAI